MSAPIRKPKISPRNCPLPKSPPPPPVDQVEAGQPDSLPMPSVELENLTWEQ